MELLIQDLCARLPYGIKVLYNGHIKTVQYIEPLYNEVKLVDASNYTVGISEIKPYLRPMSSMTEEEKNEYDSLMNLVKENCINAYENDGYALSFTQLNDWLNKKMFDYRGLISKNLAVDVTNSNNPYAHTDNEEQL